MSIKSCQREYFTEQLPDALPLAILEDINESFSFNYKLPKQEKKMRKAMRFAKTVYVRSMNTKFAKTAKILTYEKLEVDEVEMLKPFSSQMEYLLLMTGFTREMVEKVTCVHVLSNWMYCLKLPLSSSVAFMKGSLNEKIKDMEDAAESAALLKVSNAQMKKDDQDRIYKEIREKERAAKEADALAEQQRAARRRQAAVELMDLDMIIIRRVQKMSVSVPYVEGKSGLGRIFLSSWQHQHLLDEACGGVYGLPERPELEVCSFEFRVFLPPPLHEEGRQITLSFLFDRIKLMFILTKKLEDRLLLYVLQGGRGNLWQHDITPLASAVCRVGKEEYSTVDVFLQKNWRRLLIRHIAPLRQDPARVAYVRELRERVVREGDVAMERVNITPEGSASEESSSSEDSVARKKRLRREKRLKKKKEEERKARRAEKRKKKKEETANEQQEEQQEEQEGVEEKIATNQGGEENEAGLSGEGETEDVLKHSSINNEKLLGSRSGSDTEAEADEGRDR